MSVHIVQKVIALCVLCVILSAPGCGRSTAPSLPPKVPDFVAELPREFPLVDVSSEWNIVFEAVPENKEMHHLPAIMGSGCAIFDFDRNGHLDILLLSENCGSRSVALYSQERLAHYVDRSDELGLSTLSGTGLAIGDCNNDGWPDLYVTSVVADTLWLNMDGHRFEEQHQSCGLANIRWSTSACWLDFDRDGWLDLFVTNYVDYKHQPCTRLGGGDADFCSPSLFDRTPDTLYRNVSAQVNDGRVHFKDVSLEYGITKGSSAGLGVVAGDFTDDGWIDIYVASDQHPNLLWVNDTGKGFTERASIAGLDLDYRGRRQASMGIAVGNIDSAGPEELIVSHLTAEPHAVYQASEVGLFVDVCRQTGIADATRPLTGFGIAAADFDLDGQSEILTVNGLVRRSESYDRTDSNFWRAYRQPLQLLDTAHELTGSVSEVNRPSHYSLVSLTATEHLARGLAVGDLNGDGSLDALVSTVGESAMVLENQLKKASEWLRVRVIDPERNGRSCPGAVLNFRFDNRNIQYTLQPCQSYGSVHADELIIAIPDHAGSAFVDVVWPHGSLVSERFSLDGRLNETVELAMGQGRPAE